MKAPLMVSRSCDGSTEPACACDSSLLLTLGLGGAEPGGGNPAASRDKKSGRGPSAAFGGASKLRLALFFVFFFLVGCLSGSLLASADDIGRAEVCLVGDDLEFAVRRCFRGGG